MYFASKRQIRFALFILFWGTALSTAAENPSDTSQNPKDKKNFTNQVVYENIELNDYYLSNDGDNEGIQVEDDGDVNIVNGSFNIQGNTKALRMPNEGEIWFANTGHIGFDANARLFFNPVPSGVGALYIHADKTISTYSNLQVGGSLNVNNNISVSGSITGDVSANKYFSLTSGMTRPNIITWNSLNYDGESQGGFLSVNSRFSGTHPNWIQTSTHSYDGAMFMRLAAKMFEIRFGAATNSGGVYPGDAVFTVDKTSLVAHDVEAKIETTQENAILGLKNNSQEWKIINNINDDFCIWDNNNSHTPFILENGAPENTVKIASNGNVGIGTNATDTDSKLTVAGKISAQDITIKADAGGADFVFEKDYALPPLDHVEQFVKDNKHLPDIPSAKEMQENGVQISEMQAKLLQKIEELTLYIINQDKYNKILEARIDELEKTTKIKNTERESL